MFYCAKPWLHELHRYFVLDFDLIALNSMTTPVNVLLGGCKCQTVLVLQALDDPQVRNHAAQVVVCYSML